MAKTVQKFKKYLKRVKSIVDSGHEENISSIANLETLAFAFYQIFKYSQKFEFEDRKNMIKMFKVITKIKDMSDFSPMLFIILKNTDFGSFLTHILVLSEDPQMTGSCGKLLRFFARSMVTQSRV